MECEIAICRTRLCSLEQMSNPGRSVCGFLRARTVKHCRTFAQVLHPRIASVLQFGCLRGLAVRLFLSTCWSQELAQAGENSVIQMIKPVVVRSSTVCGFTTRQVFVECGCPHVVSLRTRVHDIAARRQSDWLQVARFSLVWGAAKVLKAGLYMSLHLQRKHWIGQQV